MEKLLKKLMEAGHRLTGQRRAVLEYLLDHHSPISARALHREIGLGDRASVYRTLNILEELRLVNVETVGTERLYCLAGEPHHHIICRQCGYTERIRCDHPRDRIGTFTDINHQLTMTGLCRKCRRTEI